MYTKEVAYSDRFNLYIILEHHLKIFCRDEIFLNPVFYRQDSCVCVFDLHYWNVIYSPPASADVVLLLVYDPIAIMLLLFPNDSSVSSVFELSSFSLYLGFIGSHVLLLDLLGIMLSFFVWVADCRSFSFSYSIRHQYDAFLHNSCVCWMCILLEGM